MFSLNQFTKRALLTLAIALSVAGCLDKFVAMAEQAAQSLPPPQQQKPQAPYQATITVKTKTERPVNRKLLGNNIQWVDRGDEILEGESLNFSQPILNNLKKLKPSVLRYPGGSLADLYHWKKGIGSAADRGQASRFHGDGKDKILFGTIEFLKLCRILDAEPLITVNVATGTAEEAAEWVTFINKKGAKDESGKSLPKVHYWEIGNEPYLIDDNQKKLALTPEEYARRANEFIRAMKKADSSIEVGIPLRSDSMGGIPATPLQGFNDKVLKNVQAPFEFVSLHNAYFPFVWDKAPDNLQDLYLTTMSATHIVESDFDHTQNQLKKYFPGKKIPIAVTEYNSLFTIGKGKSDEYITSLTGALYIADLLTLFSNRNDLLMANFWSVTGNWQFGALTNKGEIRPTFHVLSKFNEILHGKFLGNGITAPTYNSKKMGFVAASTNIPYLSATTISENNVLKIWAVNKHPLSEALVSFRIGDSDFKGEVTLETLNAHDYFDTKAGKGMSWRSKKMNTSDDGRVTLEPHSVNVIYIKTK
jgi:alpha-N-arabinofuranosidase